jgi:hypothetical protein
MTLKETLQIYLNRLVDLSSRNRSIYLHKLLSSQMIDLKDLNFLNGSADFSIIQELLGKKKKIPLIALTDLRDEKNNLISIRLKRLQHLSKTIEGETGEKSLQLAWPFVEGKLMNGQLIRCPLIFFPVELVKEERQWILKKVSSEEPEFNRSFLLALANAGQLDSKKIMDENPVGGFSKEAVAFRNDLYAWIKGRLPINFSQELYEDKLTRFPDVNRSLDEDRLGFGQLALKPYAVLGHFSQSAGFLIEDYEHLITQEDSADLEQLFEKYFTRESESLESAREEQMYTVFPIDASQENVLKAVRSGHSCVVEGPPGTGKSQLISNLAIDYMCRGKRVLVVSQKRAALDVVFNRLSENGFGAFLGLVHDFRGDRKGLFEKIADQIQSLERYRELNRTVDAIQLERQFSQLSRLIESHSEYFEDFRKALFNTEECDVPIKELYLSSTLEESYFDMIQHYKRLTFDKVPDFLRDFKEYGVYYRKFQQSDSFWLHRVDFSNFSGSSQNRISEILDEIVLFKSHISDYLKKGESFEPAVLFELFGNKVKFGQLIQEMRDPETKEVLTRISEVKTEEIDLLWLQNKLDTVKKLLAHEGVDWYCSDEEVEECLTLAIQYAAKNKKWWSGFDWPWERKKYQRILELLEANQLEKEEINILISKLENRQNLNHQLTLLSAKDWLELPSRPFDFTSFNHFATVHLAAVQTKLTLHEWGKTGEFIYFRIKDPVNSERSLDWLRDQVNYLESKLGQWLVYFSKIQIQHLFVQSMGKDIHALKNELPKFFDELVAFDGLRKRLGSVEIALMEKILDTYPESSFNEMVGFFLSGLKHAWIDHIEKKYPVLREISTPKALNMQEELMSAVVEKWKISRFIAELRLREKTFQELEFNRLGNLLTYRELLHQVSKKKRVWSIKKLVESFESEIFRLVPCWLCSPETVSALFPMQQSFDLVIFDESSQCFVERGLPAMLRGKQAVIAGDSCQLQPFDLYQVRLDTDEEGLETENDSLLNLASNYFQKFWLQGHYRSSQPELIYFSNRKFYGGRLEMLSQRALLNQKIMPFQLHHVEGVWEKQQNHLEADKVVSVVRRIQSENPKDSIGIITFNFFQMELIREKLEVERQIDLERLKVKNIENVQGDEFDQVVFSTGYARNKKGKLIANFGLLSRQGGGNRLNVAITRAKKKIILVTSLNSRDFSQQQLKNEGIALLKNYFSFIERLVNGEELEHEERKLRGYESAWFLKDRLAERHKELNLNMYSASLWMDMAIRENGKYKGAILSDDDRLYGVGSAKEAFVYHPLQLKEKGWPYRFVFSRQYWMGQDFLG